MAPGMRIAVMGRRTRDHRHRVEDGFEAAYRRGVVEEDVGSVPANALAP